MLSARENPTKSRWIIGSGRCNTAILLPAAFSAFLGLLASAAAQTAWEMPGGMSAPVDLYGNSQAIHPERRPLEVFQNDVQRQILGGYQTLGRRIGQRGYDAFALPTDQFMRTMMGRQRGGMPSLPGSWQQRSSPFGLQEKDRKTAFRSYGGFGERRSPYAPGDPEGLFTRKRSLIAATGSTAPIERNRLSRGGVGSLRFPIAQTPFEPVPPAGDVTPPEPDSLSRFLTSGTEAMHARASAEAWDHFKAGDYRAAIRTFDSASMLDENDVESRIGAIYACVSIGSVRSAVVALDSMYRRDPNIFAHDVSMNGKYGDPLVAQQVRLSVLSMAEASDQSPEFNALSIFVLWYMDARDDALRAARLLASRQANQRFADWPALMTAAMSKPEATPP